MSIRLPAKLKNYPFKNLFLLYKQYICKYKKRFAGVLLITFVKNINFVRIDMNLKE